MSVYSRDFWSFGSPTGDSGGYVSQDSSGYLYVSIANGASGFTVSGSFSKTDAVVESYLIKFDSVGNPISGQRLPRIGSGNTNFSYVDNLNNSYLMGWLTLSGFTISGLDITKSNTAISTYFIKYNNTGNSQFAKIIDNVLNATALSLSTDSVNNVYYTGQTQTSGFSISGFDSFNKTNTLTQSFIAKYDSSGTPLWGTFLGGYVGTASGTNTLRSIITDSSDNLYALGEFGGLSGVITISGFPSFTKTSNTIDAFILKYNSSGTPLWATVFGGLGTDTIYDGTLDTSGNLYVTGMTNSSGFTVSGLPSFNKVNSSQEAFMIKYNISGIPLFGTITSNSGAEVGRKIQVDAKNNIYVYGTTTTSGFTISGLPDFGKTDGGTDGFIVKYNSSGIPKWGTLLNASGSYSPGNMILNGNKIITGGAAFAHRLFYRNVDNTPGTSSKFVLLKVNSNGLPIMSKVFTAQISAQATKMDLINDSSGFMYTNIWTNGSGSTISGLAPKTNTNITNIIIKLNSSGIPTSKVEIDFTFPRKMTMDNSNNILVATSTGQSGFTVSGLPAFNKTNTQQNGVFLKYNTSLNPLWGVIIGVSGNTSTTGCTSDSSGNIYIIGETNQSGFSVSGFGSFNKTTTTTTGYLLKYSPSGTPLWGELIANQDCSSHKIAIDTSGFLYVTGYTSVSGLTISGVPIPANTRTGANIFCVKYDSSGIPLWYSLAIDSVSGGSVLPLDIVAGNNLVCITSRMSLSGITISGWVNKQDGNNGYGEIRFSKDGAVIYARYLADTTTSGGAQDGYQGGVVITPQDEVVIGNSSEYNPFTISGFPNFRSIATSGLSKGWLAKFDSSGNSMWGRTYDAASYFSVPQAVTRLNDGSFAMVGYFSGSGYNHYGYSDNDAYVATYTQQATAPDAPSAVSVLSHSDGVASIGWTDGEDGLSPITSYTITGNPGGTAVVTTNPGTISGLVDGVTYTFRVQAINAIGTSAASTASSPSTATSAGASAIQNVASNPTGVTDYMATQTAKPADILALEMRATIQNSGLSQADAILATVQYIKGMRTKIGGGVVSVMALDSTDFATFLGTLTSSTMTSRPIDVLYPDFGGGTAGTISLQYAVTDNSKYYVIEVPNGYNTNIISGSTIVNIAFKGTFAIANGKTLGLGDTITIGTKSLLITGFGSLAYLVQNVGSGSADPYITNIDGLHYKLPTFDGPIRFYQGQVDNKLLTVNVSLRTIASKELYKYTFESYLRLKNEVPSAALVNIEKQLQKKETLTFFDTVYIKYDNTYITLNVWDSEIRVVNHSGNIPCKVEEAQITNESVIYEKYKGKTLKLRFGNATVNVSVYTSPLIRNGVSITAPDMKSGNGIIVNALNSQAMKIPSLTSEEALIKNASITKRKIEKEFYVDNGGYREKHVIVLK